MKNSDMPAMPQSASENGYGCNYGNEPGQVVQGLTKREMFAMHAMQGILANTANDEIGYTNWASNLAEHATKAADAILAELDKCES